MKPIILSVLLVAAMSSAASAQVSFGPEFGMLVSNYVGSISGSSSNTSVKVGITAGGEVDARIVAGLFIQTGILYVMNGWQVTDPFGNVKATVNTIEIPADFVYKFGRRGKDGLYAGFGPYFAYNFSGNTKETSSYNGNSSSSLEIGNDVTTDVLKPVDLGVRFVAGSGVVHGFSVKLHFQTGVVNLIPGGNSQGTLRNYNAGVTFGYLIGGHNQKGSK